jgi:hypothetical protein
LRLSFLSVVDYYDRGEVFDMRILVAATLLVCCARAGFAQDHGTENLCNPASASTVGRDGGVIIQRVVLSGKWGSNEANVYLPDKKIADGAVVFSHSAIHSDTGASVDLLSFALTLARAGAAVVVPQRTLTWLPSDRSTNREGAVVICAEHWLVDHTILFNNGEPTVDHTNTVVREEYAYVGPRLCDPAIVSDCHLKVPLSSEDCARGHYCRHGVWVPVGETEGGDSTLRILSDGGLESAQWLQRHLGLAQIVALASQKGGSGS